MPPAPAPLVTPNAQIVQVLNTAVEQVSQAVQEQVVASRHPVEHSAELQALVRDPSGLARHFTLFTWRLDHFERSLRQNSSTS
jgi:hypothetical protein